MFMRHKTLILKAYKMHLLIKRHMGFDIANNMPLTDMIRSYPLYSTPPFELIASFYDHSTAFKNSTRDYPALSQLYWTIHHAGADRRRCQ
ncbi:hypothetical protein GCM10016272_00860 [Psychrobacter glaciei]|uniref:Uncharacterized protein n=1 Tax=Psychrobacter glaciei TaxID=619771 RepID=A0ABQ3GNT8_9GAMM|nr:hypothetical protein GCM10016272_00860 [Psychrobacter glaciei]